MKKINKMRKKKERRRFLKEEITQKENNQSIQSEYKLFHDVHF